MKIKSLVRKHLRNITPYSSARSENNLSADIWMDANENPYKSALNRYPDHDQNEIKKLLAGIMGIKSNAVFLGNGSDEAIDLLIRGFCEPNEDKVLIFTPTYDMYAVCADVSNIEVIRQPLTENFQIDQAKAMVTLENEPVKLTFVCSPNNPTGNLLDRESICQLAEANKGIIVVDEAYIDFSSKPSMVKEIDKLPNLVVLQTFSKAWGMAGARLGTAYGNSQIIEILNRIKLPYNINSLTQRTVISALQNPSRMQQEVSQICEQRNWLKVKLEEIAAVQNVLPSETNFLLVTFKDAEKVYGYLSNNGIIVRNRAKEVQNCLRITIGTEQENELLIKLLKLL